MTVAITKAVQFSHRVIKRTTDEFCNQQRSPQLPFWESCGRTWMEQRYEIQGFRFSADVYGNDGNGGCNSSQRHHAADYRFILPAKDSFPSSPHSIDNLRNCRQHWGRRYPASAEYRKACHREAQLCRRSQTFPEPLGSNGVNPAQTVTSERIGDSNQGN